LYGDGTGISEPVLEMFIKNEIFSPIVGKVQQLLLLPPLGYIIHFVDIMANPATTTIPSILISFQPGTPGFGHELTLNPQTGLEDSLTYLNSFNITGMDNGVVEEFLFYWNTLWYIMFIIWIIRNIAGVFNISASVQDTSHIRELNMKKPRSGKINIKQV